MNMVELGTRIGVTENNALNLQWLDEAFDDGCIPLILFLSFVYLMIKKIECKESV
jgi:hypothetical protein